MRPKHGAQRLTPALGSAKQIQKASLLLCGIPSPSGLDADLTSEDDRLNRGGLLTRGVGDTQAEQ
jgi:hypothetical protein